MVFLKNIFELLTIGNCRLGDGCVNMFEERDATRRSSLSQPTAGSKLYTQIIGIPMDTNYTPLVADLFLFSYERDFVYMYNLLTTKHVNPARKELTKFKAAYSVTMNIFRKFIFSC